jgi:hypothetical protein
MREGIRQPHPRDRVTLVHIKDVKWRKLTFQQWNQMAKSIALAGFFLYSTVPGIKNLATLALNFNSIPMCDTAGQPPEGGNLCRPDFTKNAVVRFVLNLDGKKQGVEVSARDLQKWAQKNPIAKENPLPTVVAPTPVPAVRKVRTRTIDQKTSRESEQKESVPDWRKDLPGF